MQGIEGPHLVANAAFLAEKTAKESAEGKLTTLRRTLAHKDDLLKTLKAKAGLLLIPSNTYLLAHPLEACKMIFTCTQALKNRSMHEAGLGIRWYEHMLDMLSAQQDFPCTAVHVWA